MESIERSRFDGLTVVALAFLVFLGFNALKDQNWLGGLFDASSALTGAPAAANAEVDSATVGADGLALPADALAAGMGAAAAAAPAYDPNLIFFPYPQYTLTQGPHGADYGHIAIDITAGNGALILSPISGIVSAVFIDEYNNTNLILDNERYTVTLLHGNYTVVTGQPISAGDVVGTESNNGYTLDAFGQLCAGRDCGYHSHLNVFDKAAGANVNPLEVLAPLPPSGG